MSETEPKTGAGAPQSLEFCLAYSGLFFLTMSLVMAALMLFARRGLYTPPLLVMTSASLLACAAFVPFLLPQNWRDKTADRCFVYPLASLAMLASPLLVWVWGSWFVYLYPPLALLAIFRSFRFLKKIRRGELLFLVIVAPLLSIYVFLYFNPWNYAGVYAPEKALLGIVRKDTYYATSIAYMLQNFRVGSIGVDGLLRHHYHIGSHFWFASLGKLTGQPPLFSYPIGLMVAGMPAQFLALVLACICAARNRWKITTYLAIALSLVFIMDALGRPSHYVSESYGLGITAFLFFLPLLFDIISRPKRTTPEDLTRLLLAAAAVLVLGALKISVSLLWAAGLAWALFRLYGFSRKNLATVPAIALLWFAVFWIYHDPGKKFIIVPFKFFMSHPRLLFLACFLVPLLVLASASLKLRIFGAGDLIAAFRARTAIELEVLLLVCVAGALPALLLWLSIAWAWFFFNVCQWLATPLVFAYLSPESFRGIKHKALASIACLLLLVPVCYKTGVHVGGLFDLRYFTKFRASLRGMKKTHPRMEADSWSIYGPNLGSLLKDYPGYKACILIRKAAAGKNKGFAVYVPPSNTRFWQIVKNCSAQPMFVPSVTGVPMLFGLPPLSMNCKLEFYGYPDYSPDAHSHEVGHDSLCRHALARNIQKVLVLRSLEDETGNQVLDCREITP